MKKLTDQELQDRLVDWADANASRPEQVEPLEERIRADWKRLGEAAAVVTVEPRRRQPLVAWGIAAAATAAAIALLFNRPSGADLEQLAWSQHASRQTELLTRCHELFGDQLAWMVESDGRSDLGLATNPTATGEYVTIRLQLTARDPGTGDWRVVETLNVITAGESIVDFPSSDGQATQLALWAYPLDSEVISVDLRYRPAGLPDTMVDTSVAQVQRQPQTVGEFRVNGIDYRLQQTAELISAASQEEAS